MKKISLISAAAMFVIAACTKATPEPRYDQDETLYRTGKVTLLASVEDFSTKMAMPATGHGMWKSGDMIAVFTEDGTVIPFTLDGTGNTKRGLFVGEIPSGKKLGNKAIYPYDAIAEMNGSSIRIEMPEHYAYEETGYKGVMVASIGDSFNIVFKQLFSLASFTFKQFPGTGVRLVIEEPGRCLAGGFNLNLETSAVTGITASAGSTGIEVAVPSGLTVFSQILPLPVAEYKNLKACVYDAQDNLLLEQPLLSNTSSFDRALIKNISLEFPKIKIKADYIPLMGVKWAKGNLIRDIDANAAGFRNGWMIAPSQWMNINYDKKTTSDGSTTYTYDEKPTAMRYSVNPDHCDHFTFGSITAYTSYGEADYARPAGTASICGKLYMDQGCSTPAANADDAKFGDIAFWASNGDYRLPTGDELATLTQCDCQYGWIVVESVGMRVWGMLFTEPAGSAPSVNYTGREITEDELAEGLFLPVIGRHADSNNIVINYRTQCVYWSGDAIDKSLIQSQSWYNSAKDDKYQYAQYLLIEPGASSILAGYSKGYAYDRRAGFCIRPVMIK